VLLRQDPNAGSLSDTNASNSSDTASCHQCDLNDLFVPPQIAWLTNGENDRVCEDVMDFSSAARSYWDRLGSVAVRARAMSPPPWRQTLREKCLMHGNLTDFLVETLQRKHDNQTLMEQSPEAPFHQGLFIVFKGDSFMRITLTAFSSMMTANRTVLQKLEFDKKTYHKTHLFCCQGPQGLQGYREYNDCTVDYGAEKYLIRDKLVKGNTCLFWDRSDSFAAHVGHLRNWYSMEVTIVPDMIVANGGLHYTDWLSKRPMFYEDFAGALSSYAKDMSDWRGRDTSLVLVSSTQNSFYPWDPQRDAYETMRRAVSELQPWDVQRRVSYIDFHTMAGTDSCGFAHKFPARAYWETEQDQCGNNYTNADVHLSGGAYLHLAEIVSHILYQGRRRCDPGPFQPVTWTSSGFEEAQLRYMSKSIRNSSRPKSFPHMQAETGATDQALQDDLNLDPKMSVLTRPT